MNPRNIIDSLTHLVESPLPEGILIVWKKQRSAEDFEKHALEKLMTFLQKKVQGQEMVVLSRTGFETTQKKDSSEKI